MEWFTGIGSRSTPAEILGRMSVVATILEELNFTLRSGGAKGADKAFEKGTTLKDIILPSDDLPPQAYELAKDFFDPFARRELEITWHALRPFTKRIMARNVMQVLGRDLNSPSNFVICWTPDGCECAQERKKETGGTGQAIAVASTYQIPVYNLYNESSWTQVKELLREIGEDSGDS